MLKRIVIPAGLLLAVLALGGVLAVTHLLPFERKTTQATATPPTVPVVAGTVAQHDVPIYLTGVGTVIAYNTVVVRSQIQGQLVSINFTEGQSVHTGDLLAQIDPAALPGADRPDHCHARSRSGPAHECRRQISDRYTSWERRAGPRRNWWRRRRRKWRSFRMRHQGGRGAHRSGESAAQLHAADLADRWSGRHSSDRHRQHHPPDGRQRARRRHAARADFADIHAARRRICRKFSSSSKRPRGRSRFSPTARTTRSSSMKARSVSSTTRSCRRPARSSSRRIFPTRRIGSGRASSSTRGCSSIPGMTG